MVLVGSCLNPRYYFLTVCSQSISQALKEFNFARKDTKWGGQALLHMVEIYLNPDNDAVWEEKENADTQESREAVATARSLMGQVRPQDRNSLRYKVLYSYSMMAGKDKTQTETALSQLLDLANVDPNNVPILLALATGECQQRELNATMSVCYTIGSVSTAR